MQNAVSRRTFLGAAAASVGTAALTQSAPARAMDRPPNVLYIVCDQMRGDALGLLGNPNAHTPNLDQLAQDGVCCTRWFSNNPVCAPSRATAFTGRFPHEHGKTTNHDGDLPDQMDGTLLGHFAERGYRLGWVGKNHTYEEKVLRGLDFYKTRTREPFRKYPPGVPPWWHGTMEWPADECHGALNTKDAIEFLETSTSEQPFFLHVGYFDPHPPYFAPKETVRQFGAREMQLPENIPPEALSQRLADYARALCFEQMDDEVLEFTMRYYHASIAWGVDAQVGVLMAALEESGLRDNTVVVFTSDHGDFMGHHGMVRKGMFHYDDLLHVPMIWNAPGRIEGGRRVEAQGAHVDLFATLAGLTGGDTPEHTSGTSYAGVLRGDTPPDAERTVYASATYGELPENYFDAPEELYNMERKKPLHETIMDLVTQGTRRTDCVRTRDWKLIRNETGGHELYKLDGGTEERENVIGDPTHKGIRETLEREADKHWAWG